MNELLRRLTKYLIILTFSSVFSFSWFYIEILFYEIDFNITIMDQIPSIVGTLIQIAVAVMLFIESRKLNLPLKFLTLLAALYFPLLGVVIFSINLLTKEQEHARQSRA